MQGRKKRHSAPQLFDPKYNWSSLVDARGPEVEKALTTVKAVLTDYACEGIVADDGLFSQTDEYDAEMNAYEMFVMKTGAQLASENVGAISPGMTPTFFRNEWRHEGTTNYEPDTSYLDWIYQKKMVDEVEKRDEWDADFEFVRMDQYGQVKYGSFKSIDKFSVNYEYGSGIKIYRTWFETNKFGIKMESAAPKMRYAYFHELLATYIYTTAQAAWVTGIATTTQNVIRDINTACNELRRTKNSLGKYPWAKANFRIIAPPEMEWLISGAMAMSYALLSRETLVTRPAVTYTTLLPAGLTCYVVVDGWEQNELGTRVPFGVFGTATDIDSFADKISYRGAWGAMIDAASARRITWDPTDAAFIIGGPIGTIDVTP